MTSFNSDSRFVGNGIHQLYAGHGYGDLPLLSLLPMQTVCRPQLTHITQPA